MILIKSIFTFKSTIKCQIYLPYCAFCMANPLPFWVLCVVIIIHSHLQCPFQSYLYQKNGPSNLMVICKTSFKHKMHKAFINRLIPWILVNVHKCVKKCFNPHVKTSSRPTNKPADQQKNGKLEVGIADDQAKDFDFEKTEMKYDSTGMFHWTPARAIEDCILVKAVHLNFNPVFNSHPSGPEPSRNDGPERPRGGLFVCRP